MFGILNFPKKRKENPTKPIKKRFYKIYKTNKTLLFLTFVKFNKILGRVSSPFICNLQRKSPIQAYKKGFRLTKIEENLHNFVLELRRGGSQIDLSSTSNITKKDNIVISNCNLNILWFLRQTPVMFSKNLDRFLGNWGKKYFFICFLLVGWC